jgi:hypothetical protein
MSKDFLKGAKILFSWLDKYSRVIGIERYFDPVRHVPNWAKNSSLRRPLKEPLERVHG